MVKTPHTRHSKSSKEPVTIDLSPGEVSRVKAEAEAKAAASATPEKDRVSTKPDGAPETTKAAEPTTPATADKQPGPGPKPDAEKPKPASASAAPTGSQPFGRQEPKAAPPPSPAAKPASGRGGAVSGAIAGGLVALLVAGGLSYSGLLPTRDIGAPAQDTSGPAIAALEAELASLREQVAGFDAGGALGARVDDIDQRMTGFASTLETVQGQVAQAAEAGEPGDLGTLTDRIAALEASIADVREGAVQETALEERIVALREEIVTLREAQTAETRRLDILEVAVGDLGTRLDEAAESPATAIIIAASSLKAAIDRGAPFTTELETYASLQPDAPEIAELRDMAASGVPTRAQLAAESNAAANAMISVSRPVDPNAGIFDRLTASAMGLVQVRPVGMVDGEGVPEITARMDAALQAGDLERALTEYDTLPAQAKAAGEGFAANVRARHAADRLVDQALAAALRN